MINALLLDLDDTLVDTGDLRMLADQATILALGGNHVPDEFIFTLQGASSKDIINALLAEGGLSQERYEDYEQQWLARYHQVAAKEARPYEGVLEFLAAARERGLIIAVVTSSDRVSANIVLEKTRIKGFAQTVITANDVLDCKPHPEPYLKALELLQLTADQAVALEDSSSGAESAHRAGLKVAAVVNKRNQDRLPKNCALTIRVSDYPRPAELLDRILNIR